MVKVKGNHIKSINMKLEFSHLNTKNLSIEARLTFSKLSLKVKTIVSKMFERFWFHLGL